MTSATFDFVAYDVSAVTLKITLKNITPSQPLTSDLTAVEFDLPAGPPPVTYVAGSFENDDTRDTVDWNFTSLTIRFHLSAHLTCAVLFMMTAATAVQPGLAPGQQDIFSMRLTGLGADENDYYTALLETCSSRLALAMINTPACDSSAYQIRTRWSGHVRRIREAVWEDD